jgi:hypothetical protein
VRASTRNLIEAVKHVLTLEPDVNYTLRGLYYQLVVLKIVPNSQASYKMVGRAVVKGRQEGSIPWHRIEDRTRRAAIPQMWPNVRDYLSAVRRSFRIDVWEWQPRYLSFWLEKQALAGIFERELAPYGVELNCAKGYDGWSSLYDASLRFKAWAKRRSEVEGRKVTTRDIHVASFGDFDPSGEDMVRSLGERLAFFGVHPSITRYSITPEDIRRYNLPPDPTKTTDSRSGKFIDEHGEVSSVELDALPIPVLRGKIRRVVAAKLDRAALQAARDTEAEAQELIDRAIGMASG